MLAKEINVDADSLSWMSTDIEKAMKECTE